MDNLNNPNTNQPIIEEKPSILKKFKRFIIQSKRVFKVTKKPSKEEFKIISKVTGIGILIIGLLGFVIKLAWELIR